MKTSKWKEMLLLEEQKENITVKQEKEVEKLAQAGLCRDTLNLARNENFLLKGNTTTQKSSKGIN